MHCGVKKRRICKLVVVRLNRLYDDHYTPTLWREQANESGESELGKVLVLCRPTRNCFCMVVENAGHIQNNQFLNVTIVMVGG